MASDVDLSQFHSIFFEECSEGIETMESGLLNLNIGEPNPEVINNFFRAAHSIKGGAGTFGFTDISEFTHAMETMLDEMRKGRRKVTSETVDLLLESIDCLRNLIDCSKADKPIDKAVVSELQQRLGTLPAKSPVIESADESVKNDSSWHISFHPHENLFYTGNDPLRLIRELHTLGKLSIHADLNRLPDFSGMDPEISYLGWNMQLHGDTTLEQVKEVFAWVEDDCELEIKIGANRRKQNDRRQPDENSLKFGRRKADFEGLTGAEAISIRVGIDKVDDLVNLVGELVISQSMLSRACRDLDNNQSGKLVRGLEQLERNTRELQEHAMRIRMLPIDFAFQRLPRLIHDLSHTLGKQVELITSGEKTELDKTVLEKIGDPLMHLVRNALDHGIETPEIRQAAGKSKTAVINISAYHEGGNIIVKVSDDGTGLNLDKILQKAKSSGLVNEKDELSDIQIQNLIFLPGFSTAAEVSGVSGRGVGMDVVKRNITDLGGTVEVYSKEGAGCTFTIRLPLTLAIVDGQMIRVGDQILIIPILSIAESMQIDMKRLNAIAGKAELYRYREEYIPVIRLHQLFGIKIDDAELKHGLLIIVKIGTERAGLYVNEILGQQQVVIKSLDKNYKHVQGIAGATILGDGSVALIIDIQGLVQKHLNQQGTQQHIRSAMA